MREETSTGCHTAAVLTKSMTAGQCPDLLSQYPGLATPQIAAYYALEQRAYFLTAVMLWGPR